MTKYRIKPKRDFGRYGYLIDGKMVRTGFVVTDGFCNVMPGATWFQTIADAMLAVQVHMKTGDTMAFWDEWEAAKSRRAANAILAGR